ncbi:MAG: threonine--tRNA ligase [Candidatus Omnitrophica bacterium]|nr:threonine--tRNA ligase [Candidatus Omnitrophota bacterium]
MNLETLRHSCSHVLAQAVKELWPEVKLGIGPAIEDGFYYDFDREEPFCDADLAKIEARMQQIIKRNEKFKREVLSKDEAIRLFKKRNEQYKLSLLSEIPDEEVTIYKTGDDFIDLCRGPHIKSTGEIKAFKLLSLAGAYWHGIETNPMLQRVYGTVFSDKKLLNDYLKRQEEAKKRDHRKLGPELGYFDIYHEKAGAGLVFYHPKGAMLRNIIEDYEKNEHLSRGYDMVITPHILKQDLWVQSGHYEYYRDNMFVFNIDEKEYALKPMNCPGHILIYKSKLRSYRDLPLRLFELGTVYRYEKSGVLHGLLRVRGFTQDDAHIFCCQEDLKDEIKNVIDFVLDTMKVFGFNDIHIELSTQPEKYIGQPQQWQEATKALQDSLKEKSLDFSINVGEGAFYGPKIDIKLKDALKRTWQCATIQCDFALPGRFDLTYIGKDGKEKQPIMLHRVILGSLERFIGALLEHYSGALPLWLSPTQVIILPLKDALNEYCQKLKQRLIKEKLRVEIDLSNQTLGKKIRQAEKARIPYILVIGEKECNKNVVSVRKRSIGDQGTMKIEDFIEKAKMDIEEKRRW